MYSIPRIVKGDTGPYAVIDTVLTSNGNPIDVTAAGYTLKFRMVKADDHSTVVADDVTNGVTFQPTQTFTASATADLLSCNGHGVKEGNQIVVSNSGGALPTGLAASTRYFAVDVGPNDFGLATRPGGTKIDITGAGSGTNSFRIIGLARKQMLTAEVATVGMYSCQFIVYSGPNVSTIPHDTDKGFLIEIIDNTR